MIAKIALAVFAFAAFAPQAESLVWRLLLGMLSAGVLSGLVGTAARGQPALTIPVNAGSAMLVALCVTVALHPLTSLVTRKRLRALSGRSWSRG